MGIFPSGSIVHTFLRSGTVQPRVSFPGKNLLFHWSFLQKLSITAVSAYTLGLRKISPGTPFPEGKHRKRGILNLQLFIFCQISGICYFQLLQGMRLLTAVAQHPNISSALPFPGRRRGGRNGGFPSGKRSETPGNIAQRPRSPHLKQPSGQQENRGSNKPRQTAKPQLEI